MDKVKEKFKYTVDDEHFTTSDETLTPNQILTISGHDPATHYLVEIHGNRQESYKDKPDTQLDLRKHRKFVSVFTGPTTVS